MKLLLDTQLLLWGEPLLLENGYGELAIAGQHAVVVKDLPPIHKDPFDRILVAQAIVEGVRLLTADALVAQHPGHISGVMGLLPKGEPAALDFALSRIAPRKRRML